MVLGVESFVFWNKRKVKYLGIDLSRLKDGMVGDCGNYFFGFFYLFGEIKKWYSELGVSWGKEVEWIRSMR